HQAAAQNKPKQFPSRVEKRPVIEKTVSMARATWDTGWFQTEILKKLLEELGYVVKEPQTMDNLEFYLSAAGGEMDLWANGWFPSHNAFLEDDRVREKVEAVGFEVQAGALQGYLVDKKTADALGIKNLGDLRDPKIARVFDRNGNGKADLVGCNVGWGCELVVEHHLDAYDLRTTVEHIQGDYAPMMDETIVRYQQGEPILFYTWTPNWTVGTLVPGKDVVWIEVPFASLPKEKKTLESHTTIKGVPGCLNDPCAMGFPPNDIRVVANKQFLENYLDVRRLLELVKIPLKDISRQNAKMLDGEDDDEDIRRHALEWIAANREKIDLWLKAARALQPIKDPTALSQLELGPLPKTKVLRVVTKRFEPFVIYQDRKYIGFSIELWEKIAENLDLEYELYGVNTFAKLLDEVERGAADVAIAGISITVKREQVLDFSHAFFETGLQIMVREGSGSVLGEVITKVFSVIFSRELFYGIAFFFIILIIASHIIWALERGQNPQFPQRYPQGLWHSIWWAVVTVTTVGYGDKTPRGNFGRLFGVVWILAGYFVFAYFTASVTTTATVQELHGIIDSPRDLFGKQVATVEKSTAADYLAGQGIPAVKVQDVDQAYPLLESGKVDAIVYDAPVLQHHASKTGKGKVKVVGLLFQEQNYGIALQVQSPYREKINIALLKVIESGAYQEIVDKWFGS
ncbi:MAG: glycine betaine/L-proline ABC transporter substrate-binding protein ProX, partial [Deltaproteobacteria bacterium]|nr:glycine betaine/L-proline ABC transporter substrate-binding protein ProX [Deltaproteobacteria bacterium]